MPRLTRAYLFLLLLGGALIAGGELLPRPDRGFHIDDLARYRAMLITQWDGAERRLHAGNPRPDDDLVQLRVAPQLREAAREAWIRHGQVAAVLFLAVVSVLHLGMGIPTLARARARLPRSGTVELAAEETLRIDPTELPQQMARLVNARQEAIAALRDAPPLRCGACRRRVRLKVLGRIGPRVLRPEGVEQGSPADRLLGRGWWFALAPAPPCSACGSTDLELA